MAQSVLSIDTELWGQEMGSRCSRTETTSEEALVSASRRGNEQAIETLFRRYQKQLLGQPGDFGKYGDAEDALQDGLLSAIPQCAAFRGALQVFDMADPHRNQCGIHAATPRHRLRVTSLDAEHPESQLPLSERLQAEDHNPEQLFAHTELKEMIQSNVDKLSSPLLTAFVLCGIEEHSQEEAAETVGDHADSNESADVSCSMQVAESLGPRLERQRTTT